MVFSLCSALSFSASLCACVCVCVCVCCSDKGQLGLGDTRSHSLPQLVESLEGCEIRTVAAGGSHSLAFSAFFKAAQELVFLQKVRAFKESKAMAMAASSRIPTLQPGGGKAGREAARRKRLGYAASASPKRSNSPSSHGASSSSPSNSSAAGAGRASDFGLSAHDPLVPLELKALLREVADVDEEDDEDDEEQEHESLQESPMAKRHSAAAPVTVEDAFDDDDAEDRDGAASALRERRKGQGQQEERKYDPQHEDVMAGSENDYGSGSASADSFRDNEPDDADDVEELRRLQEEERRQEQEREQEQEQQEAEEEYQRQQQQLLRKQQHEQQQRLFEEQHRQLQLQQEHLEEQRRLADESERQFRQREAAADLRRAQEAARRALEAQTSLTLSRLASSPASALASTVPASASSSSLFAPPAPPPPPAAADPLAIELVYSSQVHCTHRFATFQSSAEEGAVRRMLQGYLEGPHCTSTTGSATAPGPRTHVLLKQVMSTPGNTVSRAEAAEATALNTPGDSMAAAAAAAFASTHLSHTYSYDPAGPPRYTLLLILRGVAPTEDLWPAWAADLYAQILHTCHDVAPGMPSRNTQEQRANADPRQPCFRELRPPPTASARR